MRTVKVELVTPIDGGGELNIQTEVIVEDDEAEDAGRAAAEFLTAFITGYGKAAVS